MYLNRKNSIGRAVAAVAVTMAVSACSTSRAEELDARTVYGDESAIGDGTARTYITTHNGVPQEVGILLTESALNGLPKAHDAGGIHEMGHTTFERVLAMPKDNGTPFKHVLLNWNPGGHEPPGIYDLEHFDFHFYTIDVAERLAIDPKDPEFQKKGERTPTPDLIPNGYIMPAPLAFPRMGVHWVDPKSPELNGQPFTRTFIYGSWDGKLIFAEPMITKQFLESKQNFVAPLPEPARYATPGYYPTEYTIRWDEKARVYRIALGGLTARGITD